MPSILRRNRGFVGSGGSDSSHLGAKQRSQALFASRMKCLFLGGEIWRETLAKQADIASPSPRWPHHDMRDGILSEGNRKRAVNLAFVGQLFPTNLK